MRDFVSLVLGGPSGPDDLLVSFIQLIFWIWKIVEDDQDRCATDDKTSGTYLFNIWSQYVGLYVSWILYFLPVLMPILQLAQINGVVSAAGYINAVVQLVMMILTWLATGIIHIIYTPDLQKQYDFVCAFAGESFGRPGGKGGRPGNASP